MCPQCHPGLLAHTSDPDALQAALERLKPRRLHVVTLPPATRPEHDGTMTCPCADCARERVTPRKRGSMADHQPWTPRRLRRAA